jgi:hypothetical protein
LQHYDMAITKWKCTRIIFASVSWYNDILGCKQPLIENFSYKMSSEHPPHSANLGVGVFMVTHFHMSNFNCIKVQQVIF